LKDGRTAPDITGEVDEIDAEAYITLRGRKPALQEVLRQCLQPPV
jgi:hypothetical protein